MASLRVRGKKIQVIQSVRVGKQVTQKCLHVFDSFADARDLLASPEAWALFCSSLAMTLGGKSRINSDELGQQLAKILADTASDRPNPLEQAIDSLARVLSEFTPPLAPGHELTLRRMQDPLAALSAMIIEKLAQLKQKEEQQMHAMKSPTRTADQHADDILESGLAFYERGQWDLAKREFLRGLGEYPRHVDLLVHVGLCELMENHEHLALSYLTRAVDLGKEEADAMIAAEPEHYLKEADRQALAARHRRKADTAEERADLDEAFDDTHPWLRTFLEFRPFFRALTNKAVVLIRMKRYPEAIDTLHLCQSYQVLGGTSNMIGYCHLCLGNVEEAARWYREMLWPDARYVRALIEFMRGDVRAALGDLLVAVPWNQYMAQMLAGFEKREKTRYCGVLPDRLEASEFMYQDSHLFDRNHGFLSLLRCVLDDPAIDELLAELAEAERRSEAERDYRRPQHVWQFVNGCPDEGFLSYHVPRLLARFLEPGGTYWLPREGEALSLTVVEQKSRNWLVRLAGSSGGSFYFRPKGLLSSTMPETAVCARVTKAWRHAGRLFVSGVVLPKPRLK